MTALTALRPGVTCWAALSMRVQQVTVRSVIRDDLQMPLVVCQPYNRPGHEEWALPLHALFLDRDEAERAIAFALLAGRR